MKIDVGTGNIEDVADELAAIFVIQADKIPTKPSSLKRIDKALNGEISRLFENKTFTGKTGQAMVLHTLGNLKAERIMLLGLGERKKFNVDVLRKTSASAFHKAKESGVRNIAVELPEDILRIPADMQVEAIVTGGKLSTYKFRKHVSKKDEDTTFNQMEIICSKRVAKKVEKSAKQADIIADGVALAKDITNDSGMQVHPSSISLLAQETAKANGFKCKVLDEKTIEKKNMGGLYNVGKGSENPPRLVVMEYGSKKHPTVAIVGKGMVFDSGGLSLKPSQGMEVMKSDKSGAAVVIGVMQAAAQLKLPIHLIGIAPLAENMPSGRSYKPGDVIYTMSGKSVEVLNTDAEGRLILADGLTYAHQYKPKYIIDIATLTGACMIALGSHAAGLIGNDRTLIGNLAKAGESVGERLWELPLYDEYKEQMKSDIADIKNVGGRYGGCITAAAFLSSFVEGHKWAHIDIAGTAWSTENKGYLNKGATAFGVRLIVEFLRKVK
jgi:leucyl aminopeptidase